MIDTHSHLFEEEFDNDRKECIERAINNNVKKIVLVGFSKETNLKAYNLSKEYDIFYPTAGIHPCEANGNYLEEFNNLKEFIKEHKVYAIGECGLDYHYGIEFKEEQIKLFKLQLDLAIELDLPVIIHSRDAKQDTFDIIKSYNGKLKGVMHCYSGSLELAKEYIKLGFYISLGGPLTFKNAKEPKEVCLGIPLDKLLIETDCPYLAPTPFRGTRNETSYVKYVLEAVSLIKGIPVNIVEEELEKNSERLFRI